MSHIPLRDRLFEQQKGLCWICAEPMIEHLRDHPLSATIDHLVPLGNGGRNSPRNKLLAHKDCNSERGCAPNPPVPLSRFRQQQLSKLALVVQRRAGLT